MAEKLSFLVVSGSGRFVKRAHCPRWILFTVCGVQLLIMLIIPLGAADYIRMHRKDLAKQSLEAQVEQQNHELVQYRRHFQKFAHDINDLKNRMVELNLIDQHIRRVAQMDESDALFGIGGSAPDDIDTDIELEDKPTRLIIEMHRQLKELDGAAVYQQNSLSELWEVVEERGNFMAYTPTIRPAEGRISSHFGYRRSPFTGQREFHYGLDIANRPNTEIIATADGRISFVGETSGFGKLIIIDHGHGLITRYAHLDRILKKRGDTIKRGEVIGLMGSTGRSTGTHLHYEVRLNGVPVNPTKYFLN